MYQIRNQMLENRSGFSEQANSQDNGHVKCYSNLGHMFLDLSLGHSTQISLRYQDHFYSFRELAGLVNSVAELLIQHRMSRGDVIAIANDKQPLSFALMLACLRLGIVYVNIDTASPLNRNARILKVCGARMVFYDCNAHAQAMHQLAVVHGCQAFFLELDKLPDCGKEDYARQQELMRLVDGDCIAYIMFTSGSTGVPKGVPITHQNILHFVAWGQQRFAIGEADNFANLSPMYFDNSVFDFYVGLYSGASLTPVSRELLNNPSELVSYVAQMKCTVWFSVPSMLIYLGVMKATSVKALPDLRVIIFGGEGYPKTELKKLYDEFSPQVELVNVYGPTECTCICSAHTLSESDFEDLTGLPTLGQLNPNFDYKILNDSGEESDVGELCLIGSNVAPGYYNDPQRSAESFSTLHDTKRFMKRMYRTGDMVRLRHGNFYFLGRKDNQIKHMGHRIELEEIECSVNELSGVVRSVVVYKRQSVSFGKIYCFVETESEFSAESATDKLKTMLPGYMIPSEFIIMAKLPINANGKVDRKLLTNSL